ncbi:hypothetical protein FG05_35247 [Fusarium graminearum]|nr:hypothetical protein FG05_35247 [Fusarium graminearum]
MRRWWSNMVICIISYTYKP